MMRFSILLAISAAVLLPLALPAQTYAIPWWTVDGGGGTSTSTNGTYILYGTIGQPDAGTMSGGNYTLAGGFWPGAAGLRYQPDALIKRFGGANYIGENTYNTEQKDALNVSATYKAVFYVRVQNDGEGDDSFIVTGDASAGGWTIRYYNAIDGGAYIYAPVTTTGWETPNVLKDASVPVRVEVVPDTTVAAGAKKTVSVTLTSKHDPTKSDTVTMEVTKSTLSRVILTPSPIQINTLGSSITLTATPTPDPLPNVEYQFRAGYQTDSTYTWTTLQNWSPNRVVTWTPTEARKYTIVVYAREQGSVQSYQAYHSYYYYITTLSSVDISTTPPSPRKVGYSVQVKATPTGGENLRYRFRVGYNNAGTWVWKELPDGAINYTPGSTRTWTPTEVGTFSLVVYVREYGTSIPYTAWDSLNFNVKP